VIPLREDRPWRIDTRGEASSFSGWENQRASALCEELKEEISTCPTVANLELPSDECERISVDPRWKGARYANGAEAEGGVRDHPTGAVPIGESVRNSFGVGESKHRDQEKADRQRKRQFEQSSLDWIETAGNRLHGDSPSLADLTSIIGAEHEELQYDPYE